MIEGIGEAIGQGIATMLVIALLVGAALGLGGYWGCRYVAKHVHVEWRP